MGTLIENLLKPFIYLTLFLIAAPFLTYWLIDDWRHGRLRDYEKHD